MAFLSGVAHGVEDECGEEGCTERVSLPLDRYDELREGDGALLAPGHPLRRTA